MKFTGEQMIPEENKGDVIWAEHYVRYIFSSQFVSEKTVLDIACGSGFGAFYLRAKGAKKVFGVDISEEAINYARKKFAAENIQYVVGDCENIPLPKNSVDMVVSFETIEHIKDYEKFLREIKRVIKPKSLVVLSTPNKSVYPKGNPFHTKEFNYSELNDLLSKYFKHVKFLYQHNWFSSAVLDYKSVKKENLFEGLNDSELMKLTSDKPRRSLYYVVLASEEKLPNYAILPVGLYAPFGDFNEKLTSSTQLIEILEGQVSKKNDELKNIYNSRTWKIATKMKKIKKSLPLIKKL